MQDGPQAGGRGVLTFGSLFAGIGGDLGLRRAGMKCQWLVEKDARCRKLLRRHFPYDPIYPEIRDFVKLEIPSVDVVCGGDPCPRHSRACSNGASIHPDLSGYFLAVVGRLRPRWVVRENVRAPTVAWFDAALAALGYRTVVIRLDAAEVTGQSRQRDFIVGVHQAAGISIERVFSGCGVGPGNYTTRLGSRPVAPCLTTHRTRHDSRDCYIWESGGLRILEGAERCRLAGFPDEWAAGFSEAAQAKMYGNALVPGCIEFIGRRIIAADRYKGHDGPQKAVDRR